MNWPGMGDPRKRKKVLKFLAITAGIGVAVGVASTLVQLQLNENNPLKTCIDDRTIQYKIKATLELYVDKQRADIPANIGINEGCHRALYTLTDDGTIHAEWEEEYPFEIGHFLWLWDFPLRDMVQDKSRIIVNGELAQQFINTPLEDGHHYKAEFISKNYESSANRDFLPPEK